MAWERSFEKRVMAVRNKELKYQRLNYIIEVCISPTSLPISSTDISPDLLVSIPF